MIPNISLDNFINDMGARIGVSYSEEQRAFLRDFTSPIISFSCPGTGKTKSAIGGLIVAELYHQIPGSQIFALSFTNMSTGELEVRHKHDCEAMGIRQTVNFCTLHRLCTGILKEHYRLLGITSLNISSPIKVAEIGEVLLDKAQELGIKLHPWQLRPLIEAFRNFNSSLIFDRAHVESKYLFKKCKLPYEDFTKLRKFLYVWYKFTNTVPVDHIMLYTLELLLTHPEVSDAFKAKCKVLLVDEFQDLSLLQLRLISLLSDNVIAIGDIKQQIYAFNGACQEIVPEFKKYFPTARELNLTQSFRCANPIADFSKVIIHPNNMNEDEFKGKDIEGTVTVEQGISLSDLCSEIEADYRANRNTFSYSTLFLFRNNYSAIPISEELYKRQVPFQVNNYTAANQIPVIREMCAVVELASNPHNLNNLAALAYILPEQKEYRDYRQSPIYKVCEKEGCCVFDAPYNFRNAMAARKAFELLLKLKDMLATQRPMRDILNELYPLFYEVYLEQREPYLEMPAAYYIRMVQPLVATKTYFQFVHDEVAKLQVIQDSNARRQGVRCYTFHASKGLEADHVVLLDASADVVPSTKQLDQMEKFGCAIEKAREIRNERSLLFVAATRAKTRLTVTYVGHKSSMLTNLNEYEQYDRLYTQFQAPYDDVRAFEGFYKGGL